MKEEDEGKHPSKDFFPPDYYIAPSLIQKKAESLFNNLGFLVIISIFVMVGTILIWGMNWLVVGIYVGILITYFYLRIWWSRNLPS